MSTVTDNDLRELKDLINNGFNQIKQELNGIDKRLTVIETRMEEWRPAIAKISELAEKNEKLEAILQSQQLLIQKIPELAENMGELKGLNSRFNIMTIGFLSIIGVLVTGILGAIAKLVFFPNP